MEPSSRFIWSPWEPGFISLLIYGVTIFALLIIILFLTKWLGEKRPNPEKLQAFESGMVPTGSARFTYPIPYYLVAAFFLIFDVEAIFIFAWAIAADPLGWSGWLQISFFILVLLISLFYIWQKGGLEWGPKHPKKPVRPGA